MAQRKATLGVGAGLSDYLCASPLAQVYSPKLIQEILRVHGVERKRLRMPPLRTLNYYSIALSLYPECAYEAVFEALPEGLHWAHGGQLRLGAPALARFSPGRGANTLLHE